MANTSFIKVHFCIQLFISSLGWGWPQYFVQITRYVFSCQTSREVSPSIAYPTLDRGNLYVPTCILHCLEKRCVGIGLAIIHFTSSRLRRWIWGCRELRRIKHNLIKLMFHGIHPHVIQPSKETGGTFHWTQDGQSSPTQRRILLHCR